MSTRRKSRRATRKSPPLPLSLPEHVQAQREALFRAMGILEACRLGSESMLAPINGGEDADFGDALSAAYDLLNGVARELKDIIDGEHGRIRAAADARPSA